MYTPKHFEENRPEVLQRAVADYPLGLLVTTGPSGLDASLLPFLLRPEAKSSGTLLAHVARTNSIWRDAADAQVLVVFQGPAAYVSPNWYPSKATDGSVVPTWNYVMVQARGVLRVHDDRAWLRAHVTALTTRHERTQARPWAVDDAPADYVDKLLGAIVGLEIPLQSLVGKWKLSQNRPAPDREGVVQGLRALDDDGVASALAAWMLGSER